MGCLWTRFVLLRKTIVYVIAVVGDCQTFVVTSHPDVLFAQQSTTPLSNLAWKVFSSQFCTNLTSSTCELKVRFWDCLDTQAKRLSYCQLFQSGIRTFKRWQSTFGAFCSVCVCTCRSVWSFSSVECRDGMGGTQFTHPVCQRRCLAFSKHIKMHKQKLIVFPSMKFLNLVTEFKMTSFAFWLCWYQDIIHL